jgi:phosphoserine phosphatase
LVRFKSWFDEGIISYRESQKLIEKIYKSRGKATLDTVTKVISKYTFLPHAKELIKYLKGKGYEIALISGSIDILVEKIAHELDIKFFAANNLFIFDDKDNFDYMVTYEEDNYAKLSHLQGFARQLGISLEQCICIGDGDNDSEMFIKSKHGITFKGSKIENLAWKVVDKLEDVKNIL